MGEMIHGVVIFGREARIGFMDFEVATVSSQQCLDFVRRFRGLSGQNILGRMDVARVASLIVFERRSKELVPPGGRVAVVSGSESEPEIALLDGPLTIESLSYEENPSLFDLTLDWRKPKWSAYRGAYDLVLCEQVLEHLIDPRQAVRNLSMLLKPGGMIHLSVPAINNRHGLPDYFFAGFPPETLATYALDAGLIVQEASSWASDKAARMYATCDWAPLAESGPIRFFIQNLMWNARNPRSLWKTTKGRARNFVKYPFQPLFQSSSVNGVISWLIARKP